METIERLFLLSDQSKNPRNIKMYKRLAQRSREKLSFT